MYYVADILLLTTRANNDKLDIRDKRKINQGENKNIR